MMSIVDEIVAERRRQVESEGWTAEHDNEHDLGQLARAAAAYALFSAHLLYSVEAERPDCWPWESAWWKPKDRRRDLIRSAALIVAEIERLDRNVHWDNMP